jgi:hypothetical protein
MRSAAALALLLLAGCERIFVISEAEFSKVDVACVDAAISGAAGVGRVDHRVETSQAPNSASAEGGATTQSHWWNLSSEEPASVHLAHDGRDWTFTSVAMQWGTAWTPVELEAFSPEMAVIHAALMRRCGLRIPNGTRWTGIDLAGLHAASTFARLRDATATPALAGALLLG